MIDCSEKRKRQLVFELQSSRVFEKRSKTSLSCVERPVHFLANITGY